MNPVMRVKRIREKRNFNDGYCKDCNTKLRHFDTDEKGRRGYICDKCGDKVWVSFRIDKNFNE